MTTCPICSDTLPDDAEIRADTQGHCMICGRRLKADTTMSAASSRAPGESASQPPPERYNPPTSPAVVYELSDSERRRVSEMRRLQEIAYGGTPKSMQQTKIKGLLALMIIVCILVYAYIWDRHNRAQRQTTHRTAVTFRTFNTLFGPPSPLTAEEKTHEFRHFRSAPVRWKGTVTYVNLGRDEDLYIVVRHPTDRAASDVLVRFEEARRAQLEALTIGQTIRYSGRLSEFDKGTGFILLRQGEVRVASEVAPN